MDFDLQMHVNADGSSFPVNCESNRRLSAGGFAAMGCPEMTAVMCGFLFLFLAMPPKAQEQAERVGQKLQTTYAAGAPGFWKAAAMRLKSEKPQLFERLAADDPEPFVSHQWPAENLDN
jgi:hypothetical protein